jgi:hypothetical protein
MRQRILNILVSLDSFIFVLLTLGVGRPGETISSAAYRSELKGGWFRFARPVIDLLLLPIERDHCKTSYYYSTLKLNLPEDMR